jgi:sugar O-acyltransferase (sialic acid O-acetyltransferase NeuD family)
MQDLFIFPYNGNAMEALDGLSSSYNILGFVDDNNDKLGMSEYGIPVFDRSALNKYPQAKVLAVPGGPKSFTVREEVIASLNIDASRFISFIHPSATVSSFAKIGTNCFISAGVVITSNAFIGSNVCILPNSVIHHDTRIGDYTMIGSCVCIAGFTTVGSKCYIGSGSNIMNNIEIGDQVLIGMGSNVIRSVEAKSKVAGNPARKI